MSDESRPGRRERVERLWERTDSSRAAVEAARLARGVLPAPQLPAGRASDRVAELVDRARPDRPSAVHELAQAAVGTWQRLVTPHRDGVVAQPVTLLFTDLVEFSSWALRAGDEQVLRLLSQVNEVTAEVIGRRGGRVVKQLGDGTMAVFGRPEEAIAAAFETIGAVSALRVDGYRPQLRAGLHTGTPQAVGRDYLGVDVNIAARICDAAGAGELLATGATLEAAVASVGADDRPYATRRRRFRAKGVPRSVQAFAVIPAYPR